MLKGGRAEAYGTISQIQDRFGGRIVRLSYTGQLPCTSPIVQIFTFFPYTAPFTAMLRNGLGSLPG